MRKIVRATELTRAYDAVMARQNLALSGTAGSGRSYLLQELQQKLQDRRVCFRLSLRGITDFTTFLKRWEKCMLEASSSVANLNYQVKRIWANLSLSETVQEADFLKVLAKLQNELKIMGRDFLFIFQDLSQWELAYPLDDFMREMEHFALPTNLQILLCGSPGMAYPSGFFALSLSPPPLMAIWENPQSTQLKQFEFAAGNLGLISRLEEKEAAGFSDFNQQREAVLNDFHPQFALLRKRFTHLQWRLLCALAQEDLVPQPHAWEFLIKHRLGAASSVERALRNLLQCELLMRSEQGYSLPDLPLRRWLQWLYPQS